MGDRTASDSTAGAGDSTPRDAVFVLAVAVYGGVLVAGVASVGAALIASVSVSIPTAYALGFAVGFGFGLAAATVDSHLPRRLGRTLGRQLALIAPGLPFLAVWLVPPETSVGTVALWSVITVFTAGYVLSQLAGNRYVDAVAPGEPEETWQWDPPGSPIVDGLLAVLWVFLGIGNAVTGAPVQGLLWLALAGFWVANCLVEGRWSFGPGRDRCEIRLYETGLVKRRPYTKTFVPWSDVGHARLREGELVLDRGLRDVRFDRDELEDLDAALEAIDRRLAAADTG